MQASNAPTKSAVPFANSGTKNTIPVASQIGVTPGLASFTDGFPPLTMTPLAAGGVPPYGADFNGILNFLSAAIRWSQAGGGYTYDAAFSAAAGGYPKGAMLVRADLTGYWLNSVENNTTNPDTGGAGWVNPLAGRLLGISKYTSAGTFTFTPNPLARSWRVIVTGAGGGSGGVNTTAAGESKASTGGGGGGTTIHNYTTAFTSASVVVGAGGASGTAAPTNGGNGAISSFSPVGGTSISATGGSGSAGVSTAALLPSQQAGASGGVGSGGNLFPNIVGGNGGNAQFPRTSNGISGSGGASYWSSGGAAVAGVNAGGNVGRFGAGAGGCIAQDAGNFQNGATGGDGVVYIEEYA